MELLLTPPKIEFAGALAPPNTEEFPKLDLLPNTEDVFEVVFPKIEDDCCGALNVFVVPNGLLVAAPYVFCPNTLFVWVLLPNWDAPKPKVVLFLSPNAEFSVPEFWMLSYWQKKKLVINLIFLNSNKKFNYQ